MSCRKSSHRCCSSKANLSARSRNKDHLEKVKPSLELLSFYKEKTLRYNRDNEQMQEKVEQCKELCDATFQLELELQRRNSEVSSLQQVVSDLQIYLYQEREQVLQLYAENDKLKIREVANRKKIDLLLTLSGTSESELTYFMSDPKCNVPQKLPKRLQRFKDKKAAASAENADPSPRNEALDPEVVHLQMQSLSAQLEEQTNLFRDQIDSIMKDREISRREREVERNRLQAQISTLSARLKESHDKLCATTHDMLKLQEAHRVEEMEWISERDRFVKNSDSEHSLEEIYPVSGCGSARSKHNPCELAILKEEVKQRDALVAVYQEQCAALEEETGKLREQTDASKRSFKERTQALVSQVSYLKGKYADLDRRRLLEAEGFRNDVKLLRNRLQSMEKKVSKVSLSSASQVSLASRREQEVRSTVKTRLLAKEMRNIKCRLHDVDGDFKDKCLCEHC